MGNKITKQSSKMDLYTKYTEALSYTSLQNIFDVNSDSKYTGDLKGFVELDTGADVNITEENKDRIFKFLKNVVVELYVIDDSSTQTTEGESAVGATTLKPVRYWCDNIDLIVLGEMVKNKKYYYGTRED